MNIGVDLAVLLFLALFAALGFLYYKAFQQAFGKWGYLGVLGLLLIIGLVNRVSARL